MVLNSAWIMERASLSLIMGSKLLGRVRRTVEMQLATEEGSPLLAAVNGSEGGMGCQDGLGDTFAKLVGSLGLERLSLGEEQSISDIVFGEVKQVCEPIRRCARGQGEDEPLSAAW